MALLDQVSILGVKDEIDKDLIEELLGKINFDILLNLLKNINDENIEQTLISVDEIYTKGNEPRNLAENFIEFLRNIILVLNSATPENITKFTSLVSVDIEKIRACNFDKDKIIKILNTVIEYYKEIKVSTNPYLWMELAALGACKLDLKESAQPVIQEIPKIQTPIQNAKTMAMNAQAPISKPSVTPIQAQTPSQPQQPTQAPNVQSTQAPQSNVAQVPEHIAQNQDSAQIWSTIISAIPSLPTRAFFTGVAKLVGIQDKTIKLGFLNDNVLQGAKSPAKLPVLERAIEATYAGYSVEFIRIDADTKVVEVKPKIAPAPQARPQMNIPSTPQNPIKKEEKQDEEIEEQTSEREKRQYSPQVQEMIEQFSGRIID